MMTSIPHTEMRIKRNTELGVNFDIIWQNINCKILPAKIRSIWYYAVHDIFPTRSRLCKIKITADNKCLKCKQEDTIIHRFQACDNTKPIFELMTVYLKQHGINTYHWYTPTILIRPDFMLTPKARQESCLWILGNTVYYVLSHQATDSRIL